MSRLAKELAAIEAMPAPDLPAAWQAAGAGAVPSLPAGLLRRLLAQHLQEKRLGRLPAVVSRELERIAAGERAAPVIQRAPVLSQGTRLIREWNGRTISVEVLEEGFLYEGQTWRSLSEIARAVTGAHWSGPRFFGLRRNG
ncbi:DUF2924 domain-containing protein [Novosphingobium sp. TH158]|uniref:DUF2924 domain-containing protein n=1 Tax=Novosphingobium sp. TH158 TaxID=2067455 RepID=UPI000C79D924|nr:DUF2924 domain-containing protein [Novosphingobium sp. TH158]PLK26693.1 hypothetical protein C0V78_07190 [Novosphingobium sp. TH158]